MLPIILSWAQLNQLISGALGPTLELLKIRGEIDGITVL